jgi:predicted CoA-binding protein
MNQAIIDFVNSKRVAVVGVSRTGKKFGNIVVKELKERGYQAYIVHPEAKEIDGERCYPDLAALKGSVDSVVISVSPIQTGQVLRDAVAAGIQNIWIQSGAQSPEVVALAGELGVNPVVGKCILMYAQPVKSFHAFHRGFARLFGQL